MPKKTLHTGNDAQAKVASDQVPLRETHMTQETQSNGSKVAICAGIGLVVGGALGLIAGPRLGTGSLMGSGIGLILGAGVGSWIDSRTKVP